MEAVVWHHVGIVGERVCSIVGVQVCSGHQSTPRPQRPVPGHREALQAWFARGGSSTRPPASFLSPPSLFQQLPSSVELVSGAGGMPAHVRTTLGWPSSMMRPGLGVVCNVGQADVLCMQSMQAATRLHLQARACMHQDSERRRACAGEAAGGGSTVSSARF